MSRDDAVALARRLVDSADHHTQDTGEEHWKGDLDQVLAAALERLTPEAEKEFREDDRVTEVLANHW